ncbi:MAG: alpha,alpha-trehalose-phosphate synthase (UDP-forming) [Alphaproteobacteria bacterium]|nr:alpha,alpha-trehalose-phosphate synthase (UDP-forming) [Alphaproteobacteria bacterium]
MSRLVVVSNRVAPIDEGQPAAGGLAVGVLAVLSETGGIWFGWNGEITPTQPSKPDLTKVGQLSYATIGMTRRDYNDYYTGFANSTLWPLFHYRLDLTQFDQRNFTGYLRVNSRFARALQPLLRVDDRIWVHDYHLIPLGDELRRAGSDHPIGFFLHTPLPAVEILLALPRHEQLMRALCAYDLVGFQTVHDLSAFYDYIVLETGGEVRPDGTVHAYGRTLRAGVFPIGVDAENIVKIAAKHDSSPEAARLKEVLHNRKLIIGVDRLDYSKGLPQRFRAFEAMLEAEPSMHGKVTLMQVAPPSREAVGGYTEIRHELETLAGHINGRFADFDWVPIRYLNKSFDRDELTCFYRHSKVGLVTPLRDGMNLVAKEFVASQNEKDPGVLVLSRFAGAAHELEDALIVNPYDLGDVANAIHKGLTMPLRERKARWRALIAQVRRHDVHQWRNEFLGALERMPDEG